MNRLDRLLVEEIVNKKLTEVESKRFLSEIIGVAWIAGCWHQIRKTSILERHAGEVKLELLYNFKKWVPLQDCIFYADRDDKEKAKIEKRKEVVDNECNDS